MLKWIKNGLLGQKHTVLTNLILLIPFLRTPLACLVQVMFSKVMSSPEQKWQALCSCPQHFDLIPTRSPGLNIFFGKSHYRNPKLLVVLKKFGLGLKKYLVHARPQFLIILPEYLLKLTFLYIIKTKEDLPYYFRLLFDNLH